MKDRRHTNHVTDTVATHRIRHVTPMCTLSNNGWLGPHESAPQTAFRSVQPSLQLSWLHTDTDHATPSPATRRTYALRAMRAKNDQ